VIVTACNCNSSANKCHRPIQNPLLFVTEPRTRDSVKSVQIAMENCYKQSSSNTSDVSHLKNSGMSYIYTDNANLNTITIYAKLCCYLEESFSTNVDDVTPT
jgi:hypothetical protein